MVDVNERANIAGAGINLAQRVMDCGDAGHIPLSGVLPNIWITMDIGNRTCTTSANAKSNTACAFTLSISSEDLGNPQFPKKFQSLKKAQRTSALGGMTEPRFALAAIIAGIAIFSRYRARSTPVASEKSIAVFPSDNLSRDPENAYFSEGIQDEILIRLAKIAELR